jgi:hypothetical protein
MRGSESLSAHGVAAQCLGHGDIQIVGAGYAEVSCQVLPVA